MSVITKLTSIARRPITWLPVFVVIVVISAVGLMNSLSPNGHAAGDASFSVSPASGSLTKGSSYTFTIYETSAETVNTVEADLTYNASQLQFNGINWSGSVFEHELQQTGGGGSVSMIATHYNCPDGSCPAGYTGTQLVGKVSFTALADSGTATITFANTSALVHTPDSGNPTNVWNQVATGGSYSLVGVPTPPPPPPPPPPGTPPPPPSPSSSSKTTSPGSSSSATNPTPTPVATAPISSVTTYYVGIKVVDGTGKPLVGAKVTLDGITATSDNTGIASFASIPAGSYTASVNYNGRLVSQKVTVATANPATVQVFTVKVASSTLTKIALIVGLIILVLVILGGGTFLMQRFLNRPHASAPTTTAGPTTPAAPPTTAAQIFYPEASDTTKPPNPPVGGPSDGQS